MQMPSIGLGTFRLEGAPLIGSLETGLELGYRHIDTAQIYGNEAEVGQVLSQSALPRSDLFLTTKVWTSEFGPGKVIPSLELSLEKLKTDYLDLALIHWPSPNDEVAMAVYLEQLAEARERGLTREIGVSNFTSAQIKQAVSILGAGAITHQQIEVHPLLQNRIVRDVCRELGIAVTAYMPLAYGKVLEEPVLKEIAARHGASPAQVSLAWLHAQGMTVIPSSTKREHQAANLAALDLRLSAEEMAAIAPLDRGERCANPDFAPAWD
ncbi:2,5-didehydrogluconate reductase DkgB [Aeromonas simiae]|uniref:2,5-didehydrogluconate reductase DkgB n=1 Tax=Aeromonas simiae TaxID=218936 RepID=UPI00266D7399|nr:2,5-didehydrogluconate reductase DkgB [Aeromonas simiae]MDO2948788.1 2,5-didehydrogluconate reductase DkgB [Aeromonas simiae]MDO2951859.1 2,5-didehydrogluconate reductase DkgB [Aeromonas simiae]MDO2956171.1 2,5-didehydrogluconate reductase DkgB [Aeromonas simiae]